MLPAGLPYRTLCGVWHRRKLIRMQQISDWVVAIANAVGHRGGE